MRAFLLKTTSQAKTKSTQQILAQVANGHGLIVQYAVSGIGPRAELAIRVEAGE